MLPTSALCAKSTAPQVPGLQHQSAGARNDCQADRRQLHLFPDAIKKAGAEVILQRLDAAAQGRLRQMCLYGGPTERARFRHCQKVLDLSKIQGLLLAFARWFVADPQPAWRVAPSNSF